jgi:thiol:disulfide interchange protein
MEKKPIRLISAVIAGLTIITIVATVLSTSPEQNRVAAVPAPPVPKDPPVTKLRPGAPVPQKVAWEPTFESALKKAAATGKPIMVDFFATWCPPCKHLEKNIYTNKDVIIESTNFINVKVDADKRTDLHMKYQVSGLPTIAWLDPQGKEIKRLQGAPAVAEVMATEMRKAHLEASLGMSL